MATLDYITASQTGPDVRYEDGRFTVYANGQRVDAFDNSQQAWAAARSAAFAPAVELPLDAIRRDIEDLAGDGMSTEEMTAYCCRRAELFAQIDDLLKCDGLIEAPNPYETGEYDAKWFDVETPLPALACGLEVVGTHDVDGTPWTVIGALLTVRYTSAPKAISR